MSNLRRDRRLVTVPTDLRELVTARVREHGLRPAARSLGITRDLTVSVLAGLDIMPGSLALLASLKS
jgi:hypothetical protein